ncbi:MULTISPECIES: aminoglycoside phosphotransferase family protein [unclassified Embleya]|uniref:aminoglycoside phosphotransferase family protein n=1 Tax=unclassified Embleya TaxID=2699296 RepID=UPI00340C13FA
MSDQGAVETPSTPPTASSPPEAAGVRMAWEAAPAGLRAAVEARLGAPVTRAVTQRGGFSPGVAARVELADGRRAFVKAVGAEANPDAPDLHRAEARITAALPAAVPVPRLLAEVDLDGWVALAFEDVDGHTPAQPWRPEDLERVLTAQRELTAALDPSPVEVPPVVDAFGRTFGAWTRGVDPESFGPWTRAHLDRLAAHEAHWPSAAEGTALVHCDLRADNILLTPDRVVFVDWPWAVRGAAWFDVVLMAPSVIMHNGEPAVDLIEAHLAARGVDPDRITAVLAAAAGFFAASCLRPAPPGLPTLRPFQRAQAHGALLWLRRRLR